MSVSSTQATSSTSTNADNYGAASSEEAPGSEAVDQFQALTDDGSDQNSQSGHPATNPLVARHEQATQAIVDFEAGLIDADALEIELLEYVALLREQGFASVAYEQRGSLRFTAHTDSLPRSIRYMSYNGDDPSREQIRFGFQSLNADDQTMMARRILASSRATAAATLNPFTADQLSVAYDIALPLDSPVSIERFSQQAALVQALAGSTLDTPELQAQLRAESIELARLMEEAGIGSNRYTINPTTGDLQIRYSTSYPPPRGTYIYNQYLNAVEDNYDYWSGRLDLSVLDVDQQRGIAFNLVSGTVLGSARSSLDNAEVFGEFSTPPSAQMRDMLRDLDNTVPVDASVDLNQMYQVNATSAQLAFQRQDLRQIEYRSIDAARAALGDQGFSLGRGELFELHRWIEGNGVEKTRHNNGNDGDPGMPPSERAFLNTWENTSREARIEYLGLNFDDWNQASQHIDVAMQARRMRRQGSFGIDDVIKIGLGIILTKATAGALGPVFTGWFSAAGFSATTAGALGTTLATAVGTTLSTYVQTGKWSIAREVFKDLIDGDLKDLLITATLKRFGVNPALANLATADNREELVKALGQDLLKEFSPQVIDFLKDLSPDVVDRFLDGLGNVLKATDDPEVIAEWTSSWWGSQLASLLGITDMSGIQLVSELLRGAVSDGRLDLDALRGFVGREVQEQFGGVPDVIVERLGGEENVLGIVAGMATQFVLDNDFDLDAAREDLKEFVENLAKAWVGEGGLADFISWLPGSENWAGDFHDLVSHAHANGWDSDAIEEYLAESPLIANIISSYVPEGVARDGLNLAFQYAAENNFDTDEITNALLTDLVQVVSSAGITQDVAGLMGGHEGVMAHMSRIFGERFIANGGDIGATLDDMQNYARAFAAGYIGDYASSMLATVLGGDAHAAIAALPELIELGVATDWDSQQIDSYVSEHILKPLGETGSGILLAALGGKDNLVAQLVSAASQAYIESGGSSTAAREAAVGVLLSALTRLTNPSATPSDEPIFAGTPGAPTLASVAADFIQYADENDWDEAKLRNYVQNNLLSGPNSGPVLALLGSFGANGILAGQLVDELISVYEQTDSKEAVVRHLFEFLMDPPTLGNSENTSEVIGTDGAPVYGVDAEGNIVDLSSFTLTSGTVADAGSVLNLDGDSEATTDTGSIKPLASYTSVMQAIVSADGQTIGQRYDMMIDTTRFYLAKWAEDHRDAIMNSREHNQLYWLEQSNLDPNLNRAAALFGRVGHNLWQGVADIQGLYTDRNFREDAGKALYELVTEPVATVNQLVDAVGGLPLDQQIELGAEIVLTGFVGGRGYSVGSNAAGMTGQVAREVVDALDGSAMSVALRGGHHLTDDTVYIYRPNSTLQASIGIPTATGQIFSFDRLWDVRKSQIDTSEYLDPMSNTTIARGDSRMSVDHILPVNVIINLDGFDRLTREQMMNLVQDRNGDLDNLMALPQSMNSSKKNLRADDWAETGFRGDPLDSDYVDWLRDRQAEVQARAEELISSYLNRN